MNLNGKLIINDRDIWTDFSAFLAEEAAGRQDNYSALLTPAKVKPHTAVALREEQGERLSADLKSCFEARDIELRFAIVATETSTFLQRLRAFTTFLKTGDKGWLNVQLPSLGLALRCYYKSCNQLTQLTPIEGGGEQAAFLKVVLREPQPSF